MTNSHFCIFVIKMICFCWRPLKNVVYKVNLWKYIKHFLASIIFGKERWNIDNKQNTVQVAGKAVRFDCLPSR
jgi:hypothetical protein